MEVYRRTTGLKIITTSPWLAGTGVPVRPRISEDRRAGARLTLGCS